MAKKGKIAQMPLAVLVEDTDNYPRHTVDNHHVQALVASLQAGNQLPPIVADSASKKIVDGWHRARAYARIYGPGSTVSVELVPYKNSGEMFWDAVHRNSTHGRPLDAMDKVRSAVMLQNYGMTPVQIAMALHTTEQKAQKLIVKVAQATASSPGLIPGTQTITLKRPVAHLQGTVLTKQQAEVHDMLPGTSFLLVAKQLRRALETGMVNLLDWRLVDELRILRDTLIKAQL